MLYTKAHGKLHIKTLIQKQLHNLNIDITCVWKIMSKSDIQTYNAKQRKLRR